MDLERGLFEWVGPTGVSHLLGRGYDSFRQRGWAPLVWAAGVAGFAGMHTVPLPTHSSDLDLRVILDACSIEVFAGGGQISVTDLLLPGSPIHRLTLDGAVTGEVWTLRPVMPDWNDSAAGESAEDQTVGR